MITDAQRLLLGYRYDHHQAHGHIHSPRVAYKYNWGDFLTLRLSFGTGFRVVNIFTEDHSALTGWREVVLREKLNPEQTLNGNINVVMRKYRESWFGGLDITGFYTWFTNKISADLDTDPNLIIYDNLKGHAVSKGVSVSADITFANGLKIMKGITLMTVYQVEKDSIGNEIKTIQLHAPKWSVLHCRICFVSDSTSISLRAGTDLCDYLYFRMITVLNILRGSALRIFNSRKSSSMELSAISD